MIAGRKVAPMSDPTEWSDEALVALARCDCDGCGLDLEVCDAECADHLLKYELASRLAAVRKELATERKVSAAARNVAECDSVLRAMSDEEQRDDGITFAAEDWRTAQKQLGEAAARYAAARAAIESEGSEA